MQPKQTVTTLIVTVVGFALIEWWALSSLNGDSQTFGPITGIAFVGMLTLTYSILTRSTGNWLTPLTAAITSLVELMFCLAIFGTLSAIAALLLPVSLTQRFMQGNAATDFIIFTMLGIGIVVAARGWLSYSRQALRAAENQIEFERAKAIVADRDRELIQSELRTLRAQIQPHFLWNTLAHIQFLTVKRPDDAERMTGHLIRFLKTVVPQKDGASSTLGEEFEAVTAYLELMKIRMGTRLTASIQTEPFLREIPFPPMIVQTLVENAIKHGVEPKVGPAHISISGTYDNQTKKVTIDVNDDGVGLGKSPGSTGTGIGLNNVRERLLLAFGPSSNLEVMSNEAAGVTARISFVFEPL